MFFMNFRTKLKRVFLSAAPAGTLRYQLFHNIVWGFLKRFRLMNTRYRYWIKHFDTYSEKEMQHYREKSDSMPIKPLISVILPVYNPNLKFLEQAISSVCNQIYPNWELCIADDASTVSGVQALINAYCQKDTRIRAVFRKNNGHISAASNSALALASGDYIALLDHDDLLHPLALYFVAAEINDNSEIEVIYSDEDKLTKNGRRLDPYFKSDFDYERLLSQNMVSHLGVYKLSTVQKVGGFRIGFEGSQDYDLLLRVVQAVDLSQICHIPRVLYHWRISRDSAASQVDAKPYAITAAEKAIREHLQHRNIKASVFPYPEVGYRIDFEIPQPEPIIKLFVNTPASNRNLLPCLEALSETIDFNEIKVTVLCSDQASHDFVSQDLKPFIDQHDQIRIEVTDINKLNHWLTGSTADFIGFIDASCVNFSKHWINNLLSMAAQPGIGGVSPKLIFENDTIHSCGIILGVNSLATHLFKSAANGSGVNYYYGWNRLHKGFSALPGDCILFKRSHFIHFNGFNNDIIEWTTQIIDLCLKFRTAGLRNVVTNNVIVTKSLSNSSETDQQHHDLVTNEIDRAYLISHWGKWIENDPAFNPNLTIRNGKPLVSKIPRISRKIT